MIGSNSIKIKFYNEFDLQNELNIEKEFRDKILFKKNNYCNNCGLKLTRNYLDVHFIDFDLENRDEENLICLCKDCHIISHPKDFSEKCLIMVLPRNRLDHLNQAQMIYYFRYLYVLKYKIIERENMNGKNIIKTFLLFDKDIINDIFTETFEYFEELIDEIDDIDEADNDFKKLIDPEYFWNFINKYFSSDEDRIEEIEDEIIVFPLFEKELYNNYLLILSLYNNLRNPEIKQDVLSFIETNREFLSNPDSLIKELKINT